MNTQIDYCVYRKKYTGPHAGGQGMVRKGFLEKVNQSWALKDE